MGIKKAGHKLAQLLVPLLHHSAFPEVVLERRDVFSHVSVPKLVYTRYAKGEVIYLHLPGNEFPLSKIIPLASGCPCPSSGR